jgi:NADPH-dependent 7-cyano-7-deazaguanine reductase QueF
MLYILMEQTANERGRIRVALRKLVYDSFTSNCPASGDSFR